MTNKKAYNSRNFVMKRSTAEASGQKKRENCKALRNISIDHFTVVSLVAWPLSESEAGDDLVLIETSLLFLC